MPEILPIEISWPLHFDLSFKAKIKLTDIFKRNAKAFSLNAVVDVRRRHEMIF